MAIQKQTLFISDLHLQENHADITNAFLKLLSQCDDSVDSLYILGDLFEAWIGDDDMTPFHHSIFTALKDATSRGLKIKIMRGNRDFLLGKKFEEQTGCALLNDQEIINLYGTRVLLLHGDTLCTLDTNYQRSRKIMRNRIVQFLFLMLPLSTRRNIAAKMRKESEKYMQTAAKEIMDVSQDEVLKQMRHHQVNFLIHGHTHRPGISEYSHDNQAFVRMVLPSWEHHPQVLAWNDRGEKQWRELTQPFTT